MADLGNLVVQLEANMAQFNQNMNEAANRTDLASSRMDKAMGIAKAAIVGLASAITVGAFAELVRGSIEAADSLKDMSQKTGVAVEDLNGLAFAAGQAGGSLDTMVNAAGKLNKSITDAANGNGDATAAFKALNISVIDTNGSLKTADVVMAEVADQFAKYKDGPEKAALAVALFGKAGADMIPLLNEGGTAMRENTAYAKQYSNQTQELSDASDNFNDTLGKLEIQQRGFANAVTAQVLPVLQLLADGILGAAEESRKFETSAGIITAAVTRMSKVAYDATADFKRLGTSIGGSAAVAAAFASGGRDAAAAALARMREDLAEIDDAQTEFRNKLKYGAASDPLSAFVSQLGKRIEEEKTLLNTRLQMINKYRADEKLSDADYAAARKAANAESEKSLNALYDFGIANLNGVKKKGLAKDPKALEELINTLGAEKSLVGAGKTTAPRFTSGGKPAASAPSATDKLEEEGKRMVARLREQDEAFGKSGAALLEYQLAQSKIPEKYKEQALAAQRSIDVQKATAEEQKKIAADQAARDQEVARAKAQNESNVEQIRASLLTEVQMESEAHAARMAELQTFHDAKLANVQLANQLMEEETTRHEQAKKDIRIANDMAILAAVGNSSDQLYSLLQQAGAEQTALGKAVFLASKAVAVAEIIMNTEVAAAKAQAQFGAYGTPIAIGIRVAGYASAGLVAGMAIASAEGGYDIPAGTNPITQLHEKEMVLPKEQAEVIRGLTSGRAAGAGEINHSLVINIDSRTDQGQVRQLVERAVQDGNAQLVDKLQRARML